MRKLLQILPIVALVAACSQGTPNGNEAELIAKRDSLLQVQKEVAEQVNAVNEQIILLQDGNKDNVKTIKKITAQKNKVAGLELKIKELESQLAKHEEDNNIAVSVKEMKPEVFNHYFKVFGNTEAKQGGMISPEMNGKIETIHVTEGQRVKEGELILTLNTEAVRKQIKGIKTNLDFATKTYNKTKALWDQKIGSEIQYLQAKSGKEALEAQLEALEAQLKMAQVRAPYSGIVNRVLSKEGEICGPAFPIIEFINLSKMTVTSNISENYIAMVNEGDVVEVSYANVPGFIKQVPLKRVSNVIDAKSRTFEVELELSNPNELIKPNMITSIRINDFSSDSAFVIPSLVVRKDISGDYVYVVTNKDVVAKKYVEVGKSYQENTMITKGLAMGDKVVIKGFSLVSTGIPVSIK
jgi:RND family efflux transporter MFP subunit